MNHRCATCDDIDPVSFVETEAIRDAVNSHLRVRQSRGFDGESVAPVAVQAVRIQFCVEDAAAFSMQINPAAEDVRSVCVDVVSADFQIRNGGGLSGVNEDSMASRLSDHVVQNRRRD